MGSVSEVVGSGYCPLCVEMWVPPPAVMLLARKAPCGTSVCFLPPLPLATFPVAFQPIGQNGLRVPESRLKEDLFLIAMEAGSSAPNKACAARIKGKRRGKKIFIVFQ